jgi:hypothetical protein
MHLGRSAAALITGFACVITVMVGCGKQPEQTMEPKPTPVPQQGQPTVEGLELPQSNDSLGVTLSSLPPGFDVTLNSEYWIELKNESNPSIEYAFVGNPPGQPGVAPSSPDEFEVRVRQSPNGRILDTGTIETDLGEAVWVAGRYDDDDGPVVDIHIFIPTPPDRGTLVLTSVCPPEARTVDQRLSVMRDLLAHLS